MDKLSRRDFVKKVSMAAACAALGLATTGQQFYNRPRYNGKYYEPVYSHWKNYPREGHFAHSEPKWEEVRKGLYFSRITAYRKDEPVDSIAAVKMDPEFSRFDIFHDRASRTVEEWQRWTGADVMFNSGYYQANRDPVGLIISNGKMKGPKVNKAMEGMFVAEPVDGSKRAKIIDLREEPFDYKTPQWLVGVQSFPMLLDSHGRIRAKKSNWYANRTAICDDNNENILALTTEGGYFSLFDMGLFLGESKLNIKHALNLDGGYEADMMIKSPKLDYLTYGQWETQGKTDISAPGIHIRIPAVVAVFPENK